MKNLTLRKGRVVKVMVEHKLHNLLYLRENLSGAWNWCGVAQSEDTGRQAAKGGEWVFWRASAVPEKVKPLQSQLDTRFMEEKRWLGFCKFLDILISKMHFYTESWSGWVKLDSSWKYLFLSMDNAPALSGWQGGGDAYKWA